MIPDLPAPPGQERQKMFDAAYDELSYAHDELTQELKAISAFVNGGDIGWNQAMELSAYCGTAIDKAKRIGAALQILYPMRTQE